MGWDKGLPGFGAGRVRVKRDGATAVSGSRRFDLRLFARRAGAGMVGKVCESKVFLATAEAEELVMEDVTSIRPESDGYRLVNLFGEEAHVRGRIKDIDLLKHRVLLEPIP